MEERTVGLENKTLALFFTFGVSLDTWKNKGLFERELLLYKHVGKRMKKIYFLTYGRKDGSFYSELARYNIIVLPKKYPLPNWLYSFLLPWIYRKELSYSDLFKTNQVLGSWAAVFSKWIYKKKLIVRSGYSLSLFYKKKNYLLYLLGRAVELFSYSQADRIVLATKQEQRFFHRYEKKIIIIPNYVDTSLFFPMASKAIKKKDSSINILYIGRLSRQKNLHSLIAALEGVSNVRLQIIGEGDLSNDLKSLAKKLKVSVDFLGSRPHRELPDYIRRADLFILPSYYEGHPKVLLEAMACGAVVIGTCVDGIKTIIVDGVNGYLSEPTKESLASTITRAMRESFRHDEVKNEATKFVSDSCSFNRVLELELSNYI